MRPTGDDAQVALQRRAGLLDRALEALKLARVVVAALGHRLLDLRQQRVFPIRVAGLPGACQVTQLALFGRSGGIELLQLGARGVG